MNEQKMQLMTTKSYYDRSRLFIKTIKPLIKRTISHRCQRIQKSANENTTKCRMVGKPRSLGQPKEFIARPRMSLEANLGGTQGHDPMRGLEMIVTLFS